MPYTPTAYTTGGNATAASLNNGETQYSEATLSFEQDLLTPFVFDGGLVATQDGVTASQLDVTAGVAFLRQTDATLRRHAPVASTQSTVGNPSATLYLDLNSDGTWSWATTHSADANHLTIATVTTDASANIVTVTDTRTLDTTLLSGRAGALLLGTPHLTSIYSDGGAITSDGAGAMTAPNVVVTSAFLFGPSAAAHLTYGATNHEVEFQTPLTGVANGYLFIGWNGTTTVYPFGVGATGVAALASVDNSGNYSGPVGGGIPTTRNGAALSVPIYTGTATPVNPPTGSIWIKA